MWPGQNDASFLWISDVRIRKNCEAVCRKYNKYILKNIIHHQQTSKMDKSLAIITID